jgi:transcription initiation factor TFIID subunit TAF12
MNLFKLLCCSLLTNKRGFYSLLENIGGYSPDTSNTLRQLRQKIGLLQQRQQQQRQQQPRHLGEDSSVATAAAAAEATDSSFQQFLNAALEEANYSGITLCSCTATPGPSSDSYDA